MLDEIPRLKTRLGEVRREKARFKATLKALQDEQKPLERLDAFRQEDAAIGRVEQELEDRAAAISEGATSARQPLPSFTPDPPSPSATELEAFGARAAAVVGEVADLLQQAAVKLTTFAKSERKAAWRSEWKSGFDEALAAYEKLASGKPAPASTAEDLRADIDARDGEIASLTTRISALEQRSTERPARLQELRDVWEDQVSARREIAQGLLDLVPTTTTGDPYVEVWLDPYGERAFLADAVNERITDNRAFNRDDAQDLVDAVFNAREADAEPTSVLCAWLRSIHDGEAVPELTSLSPARLEALRRSFADPEIRRLEVLRPPDAVSVVLRREDGSLAGSLESGLSVGQRCTAILALVLSAGDFPILIDQPEEEIDNEFIYRELVPLLRRAKHQRQVVVVTHDPNLPVNGDAELIFALEARSIDGGPVRGYPKTVDGGQAIGSLDRKRVKLAVEEIMEGSEEAFRRRYARYGF